MLICMWALFINGIFWRNKSRDCEFRMSWTIWDTKNKEQWISAKAKFSNLVRYNFKYIFFKLTDIFLLANHKEL